MPGSENSNLNFYYRVCPSSENSKMTTFFYVYVLESKKKIGKLYIGYTDNLRKRLKEHNQGLNKSTRPFRPWQLVYYEACLNQEDAKRREKYFKTSQGRRLLKRRLKEYFYSKKNINLNFYYRVCPVVKIQKVAKRPEKAGYKNIIRENNLKQIFKLYCLI